MTTKNWITKDSPEKTELADKHLIELDAKLARIVPIGVEGRRIIENRGEETNRIDIEYEETFTEDFSKKQERRSEKNEKRMNTSPPEMGRGIPIQVNVGKNNVR